MASAGVPTVPTMSLPSTWRAGAAALLLAAPLALTGCGVQTSVPANLAAPVGNGASLNGTVTPASNGISSAVTFVGTVMTSDGFTLYRYAKDRATPPTSACTGTCTASWPPVAADQLPVPYGVDAKLLIKVDRKQGSAEGQCSAELQEGSSFESLSKESKVLARWLDAG
jgi:predicted lipoprotein with Yx(FWY)xxD motif